MEQEREPDRREEANDRSSRPEGTPESRRDRADQPATGHPVPDPRYELRLRTLRQDNDESGGH